MNLPDTAPLQSAIHRDESLLKALADMPGWGDERYRLLVEHSRDLICLHAPDGTYRFVSPSATALLGWRPDELVGRNPCEFFHPDGEADRLRSNHDRVLGGQVDATGRYRFRHRDGRWVWLETLAVPLFEDAAAPQRLTSMLTSSRDVSEQIESAALRSTAEERLRLALEATGTGIFDVHLPGNERFFSDEFARVFGYGPEDLEVLGGGWQPLVHPDDLAAYLESRRVVMSGEQDLHVHEVRRMHRSGRWVWVRVAGRVVEKDAAGLPQRVIGTVHDVDERMQASLALQDSLHRLAQSQRLARVGDWRTDVDDPRSRWSDETYRILGLSPDSTLPSLEAFLERVHADDRDGVRRAEQQVLRDGSAFAQDCRVVLPDGSVRHVTLRTSALLGAGGRVRGMYGTIQDISERKQVEAALRSTAEALESAQRLARVGRWHWQVEGDRVQWSPSLFAILGQDPSKPAPPFAEQACIFTDESWRALNDAVAQSLASGQTFALEVEFVRGDGATGWGVTRGEVHRDAAGTVTGMSGTLQDTSEAKRAQTALREARDQVRELSAHLEDELNQERKRIALDVHDELGQMLTGMKLQIELLQSQLARPADAERTAGRLRELVDETMEIARNVVVNLRPPALDLGLVAGLEWLVEDFGLRTEIACAIHRPSAEVPLDEKQATALFRIAQESLTNVARHARASAVQVRLQKMGPLLVLEVRDDGTGFDTGAAPVPGHFGLLGMRERAWRIGAEFTIDSRHGAGCAVRVCLRSAAGAPA